MKIITNIKLSSRKSYFPYHTFQSKFSAKRVSYFSFLKSEKGFSIIEILLVLMIIGFIVSLINLAPSAIGLIGSSKYESLGKEIAQKKIEDLRSLGYDNICDPTPNPCNENITDSRLSTLPSGTGVALVESCPSGICLNNEEIKKLTITVSWIEPEKGSKKVEMTTLISEEGLK